MKKTYSIGEISKLFNVAVSTLRYYDQKDILKADKVDEHSRYRYYSIEQFETLSVILHLKALDMPLEMIKQFISEKSPKASQEHFSHHIDMINEKLNTYQMIKNKLERHLVDLDRAQVIGEFQLLDYNERYYVTSDKDVQNNNDIDFSLRELNNQVSKDAITITGQYGMLMYQKDFTHAHYANKALFLLVNESSIEHCSKLQKGTYLVHRYHGAHSDSPIHIEGLRAYIQSKNYEIEGDLIEITTINDAYTNNRQDYVTELQIKIAST